MESKIRELERTISILEDEFRWVIHKRKPRLEDAVNYITNYYRGKYFIDSAGIINVTDAIIDVPYMKKIYPNITEELIINNIINKHKQWAIRLKSIHILDNAMFNKIMAADAIDGLYFINKITIGDSSNVIINLQRLLIHMPNIRTIILGTYAVDRRTIHSLEKYGVIVIFDIKIETIL